MTKANQWVEAHPGHPIRGSVEVPPGGTLATVREALASRRMLPKLEWYYGRNRSANAVAVTVGDLTVWFSYRTPVAFRVAGHLPVVSENVWSRTTGAHLNAIDGGAKRERIPHERFELALWRATGRGAA